VNVTATVHDPPAATGVVQLFAATVKFADAVIVPGFIAPLPEL